MAVFVPSSLVSEILVEVSSTLASSSSVNPTSSAQTSTSPTSLECAGNHAETTTGALSHNIAPSPPETSLVSAEKMGLASETRIVT